MAPSKKTVRPCPHCSSIKGRTLLSEDRHTLSYGKIHQTVASARKFRCFGCGKSFIEESDV